MLADTLVSFPTTALLGDIKVPGDKSISHRALICGAIAQGRTTINGFLWGEDCLKTMHAFRSMGVGIEQNNDQVSIDGVGKYGLKQPTKPIDCGNSGTSMRLLSGLLAAQPFDSELTGDASLLKRPMQRISEPLNAMGGVITTSHGHAPLYIRGAQALRGVEHRMAHASAQVKSALLLAGVYATGYTSVIEPSITRDHTERMFASFSYPLERLEDRVTLNADHELMATHVDVPGDLSSAAFLMVAATITPHSNLILRDIGVNPTRMGVIYILKRMGANINLFNERLLGHEPIADIQVQYAPLRGIDIPKEWVSLAIDEFPALFIAASVAEGVTRLNHALELRYKESDRIASMSTGLKQLRLKVVPHKNGIDIHGGVLHGGIVDAYDDHRVAMAFLMAGTVAKDAIIVKRCKNIATSFPTFMEKAQSINLDIRVYK